MILDGIFPTHLRQYATIEMCAIFFFYISVDLAENFHKNYEAAGDMEINKRDACPAPPILDL